MPERTLITQEFVRSILDYDPETGVFTWRHDHGRWGRIPAGTTAGGIRPDGYRYIAFKNGRFYLHRLAWLYMTGKIPEGEIDHIDLDPSNNRWNNLRLSTHSQNGFNTGNRSDNTSGIKGVYWDKSRKLWAAEIMVNKRKVWRGRFKTLADAKDAISRMRPEAHGEFARH